MSEEKDFHVTIRVKNGRLYSRIRLAGHRSAAAFANATGVTYSQLVALLAMKISPLRKEGEWIQAAYDISSALRCEPEDIWPDHIARLRASKGSVELDASIDEVRALTMAGPQQLLGPAAMRKLLSVLSPRQLNVVERVYGIGRPNETLDEIAADVGVSRERIRQISGKGIRLLKDRAKRLGIAGPE